MNDSELPLSPDILDELLSAEIDGEFDRAAVELGFTPDDARAALSSAPATIARRAELARARDALATPPRLVPEDEARVVAAALRRSADEGPAVPVRSRAVSRRRFERSWRVLIAAGSAAAVVAGVVVLAAQAPRSESKSSASLSVPTHAAPAPRAAAKRAARAGIRFGDVTNPARLRSSVRAQLTASYASSADSAAGQGTKSLGNHGVKGPQGLTGLPENFGPQGGTGIPGGFGLGGPTGAVGLSPTGVTGIQGDAGIIGPQGASGAPGLPRPVAVDGPNATERSPSGCIAVAQRTAGISPPVLSGTGTDRGRPVAVVVFRRGATYEVYVLSKPGCSLIARESLP